MDSISAALHAMVTGEPAGGPVSATGAGEYFIRVGAAHEICARIRMKGEAPKQAADAVMAELEALGGTGGVIITGPGGTADWSFNTPGMYRGRVTSKGVREVAIYGDEIK